MGRMVPHHSRNGYVVEKPIDQQLRSHTVGLLILFDIDTSTPAWVFLQLVGGIGTGMLFSATALAVQASSSDKNMALAVTLFAFFRAFGQTIGVAIGGVVFQNVLKNKLLDFPLLADKAQEYALDSSALVEVLRAMPPSLEREQLVISYMQGLRGIYYLCLGLAAAAMVTSIFVEGLPLDREHVTEQGFQYMEEKPTKRNAV